MTTIQSELVDSHADTFPAWLTATPSLAVPMSARGLCAVYASSAQEMSVERQLQLCANYAAREGMTLQARYADLCSGAATLGRRTDLQALSLAARRGDFRFLVFENLDRISRDEGFNRRYVAWLQALGVEVHCASYQRAVRPDDFFQGLMAQEGRRILQERTQFGRQAMAARGLVPSVASFGYTVLPGLPGHRIVVAEQARVVAEAFEMRVRGASTVRIAAALNDTSAPDRAWTARSVARMLRNPLYDGRLVYGSRRTVRHPLTGMRSRIARPRAEWTVTPVEHLRLVDNATWEAVQATFGSKTDARGARA